MDLTSLFLGFGINLLVAVGIVRFIYYPARHSKNFVFTFLAFNTVIYFVMSLLTSAALGVGVGFGLFAIFSVLRYRTATMSTREMTYLFILIALPVLNSIMMTAGAWAALVSVNGVIAAVLFALEREWGFAYEGSKLVKYERLDLLHPERRPELLADVQARTGLALTRVEVGKIDLVNDTAQLRVYFAEARAAAQRLNMEEAGVADDDD
jgi:hypothetical protein